MSFWVSFLNDMTCLVETFFERFPVFPLPAGFVYLLKQSIVLYFVITLQKKSSESKSNFFQD